MAKGINFRKFTLRKPVDGRTLVGGLKHDLITEEEK